MHDQDPLRCCSETLHIGNRADRSPQLTQARLRHAGILEGFTDMPRALSRPDHIAERGRCVVEGVHAQTRIVRAGDEGIAGTKTGAQNAELLIALRFEPVEAAAYIDNRLPACSDGAPDV